MMAERDDDPLTPAEIAVTIERAGVSLRPSDLQSLIARARTDAETEPRSIGLFPLKQLLPPKLSYEVARRACADGKMRARKFGDDWYLEKDDVAAWIAERPRYWFETEGARQKWLDVLARLTPRWTV